MLAVVLDRDALVDVGEVHTGNESTSPVSDLPLNFRRNEPPERQQGTHQGLPGRLGPGVEQGHRLPHLAYASLAARLTHGDFEVSPGDQSSGQQVITHGHQPRHGQPVRHIDERARGSRHRESMKGRHILRRQASTPTPMAQPPDLVCIVRDGEFHASWIRLHSAPEFESCQP